MRNKYIKYCDIHNIKDGVLRESLINSTIKVSCDEIESSIQLRENEIARLIELNQIITGAVPGEFCKNCGNFIPDFSIKYLGQLPIGPIWPTICSQKCADRLSRG